MEQKTRETGLIISGQNRGSESSVVSPDCSKPVPDKAPTSDIISLCKLIAGYIAIFAIDNQRKSKLFEGYYFETS